VKFKPTATGGVPMWCGLRIPPLLHWALRRAGAGDLLFAPNGRIENESEAALSKLRGKAPGYERMVQTFGSNLKNMRGKLVDDAVIHTIEGLLFTSRTTSSVRDYGNEFSGDDFDVPGQP
jgi:hypothetical protein